MHILIICTGNTCRSPIAKALLKNELNLSGLGAVHAVDSAGIASIDGQPAADAAVKLLAEKGLDISGHRSKRLTPALVEWADLILVMTVSQLELLRSRFPEGADKVLLLKEYAASTNSGLEIADPYGYNDQIYRLVIEEIHGCVKKIMPKLTGG